MVTDIVIHTNSDLEIIAIQLYYGGIASGEIHGDVTNSIATTEINLDQGQAFVGYDLCVNNGIICGIQFFIYNTQISPWVYIHPENSQWIGIANAYNVNYTANYSYYAPPGMVMYGVQGIFDSVLTDLQFYFFHDATHEYEAPYEFWEQDFKNLE